MAFEGQHNTVSSRYARKPAPTLRSGLIQSKQSGLGSANRPTAILTRFHRTLPREKSQIVLVNKNVEKFSRAGPNFFFVGITRADDLEWSHPAGIEPAVSVVSATDALVSRGGRVSEVAPRSSNTLQIGRAAAGTHRRHLRTTHRARVWVRPKPPAMSPTIPICQDRWNTVRSRSSWSSPSGRHRPGSPGWPPTETGHSPQSLYRAGYPPDSRLSRLGRWQRLAG